MTRSERAILGACAVGLLVLVITAMLAIPRAAPAPSELPCPHVGNPEVHEEILREMAKHL